MTLQDWSNFAQVIGAIAVVVSLFYVGFQIKRNTSAVRSATAQAVHDNYADWYMNMMGDAELSQIAINGNTLNNSTRARGTVRTLNLETVLVLFLPASTSVTA